jgi:hypothetical protein
MSIQLWDGKILVVGNAIAVHPDCCCGDGDCSSQTPDTNSQPNAVVSDSTCDCEVGTHDGSYVLVYADEDEWHWAGQTSCDIAPGGSYLLADIDIIVECLESGMWGVTVFTYQLGWETLSSDGAQEAPNLTVDGNDLFSGTADIILYDVWAVEQCTLTITWSP